MIYFHIIVVGVDGGWVDVDISEYTWCSGHGCAYCITLDERPCIYKVTHYLSISVTNGDNSGTCFNHGWSRSEITSLTSELFCCLIKLWDKYNPLTWLISLSILRNKIINKTLNGKPQNNLIHLCWLFMLMSLVDLFKYLVWVSVKN